MTLRLHSVPMIFAATGLFLLALAMPADATQWQAAHSSGRAQSGLDLDSIVKRQAGSGVTCRTRLGQFRSLK